MQSFESTTLKNGISLIHRNNNNTPRITINTFINGGNRIENIAGTSDITTRLLLKGTKNRSAEQIAVELDANAIDMDIDVKQDYSRIKTTCLNDDIDLAIEILSDVIQNPTFEQFDKEVKLLNGELNIELDSPRAKATDQLIRAMYPDHPYGVVASKMLEHLFEIKPDDVKHYFHDAYKTDNINISCVGDFDMATIKTKLEDKLNLISSESYICKELTLPELKENKLVTSNKEDASQAQVIRGWFGPPVHNEDFVKLTVLNNILGAAGLSSRLFIELRDKKGLAYSVRSSLELLRYVSNFSVYIGTEPKNINVAIKGFDEEIEKLINEPVKDAELEAAKRNILGKRAVFHETNAQQCFYLGLYEVLKAGADYDDKIPQMIKDTTKEDIQYVAQKYLTKNHVTSILAPSEFLTTLENI